MEHLHSERRWCDFEAPFRSSRRHLAPHHISGFHEQRRSAASIWPSVETGACLGVVNGCRRRLFSLKEIEARDSSLQVDPGVALRICHFNRFFITYQHRAEEWRSLGKTTLGFPTRRLRRANLTTAGRIWTNLNLCDFLQHLDPRWQNT
jgi:hypothetical protein